MFDMNAFCQNWLSSHKQNVVSIFANEDIQCGYICTNSIRSIRSYEEKAFILTWFLEDHGTFHSDGRDYVIKPCCVLLRKPNRSYHLYLEESKKYHRYFLRLPTCLYDFLIRMYPTLDTMPPLLDIPYNTVIHQRFIELLENLVATQTSNLHWILPEFFSLILDITALSAPYEFKNLALGKSLLEKTQNDMSLEAIADTIGMSYGKFRKTFRQVYGISPGRYRIEYRIRIAKGLLLDGNSVSEVAFMLNYSDVYTFSHQFREVTKRSPSEYIRSKQVENGGFR